MSSRRHNQSCIGDSQVPPLLESSIKTGRNGGLHLSLGLKYYKDIESSDVLVSFNTRATRLNSFFWRDHFRTSENTGLSVSQRAHLGSVPLCRVCGQLWVWSPLHWRRLGTLISFPLSLALRSFSGIRENVVLNIHVSLGANTLTYENKLHRRCPHMFHWASCFSHTCPPGDQCWWWETESL